MVDKKLANSSEKLRCFLQLIIALPGVQTAINRGQIIYLDTLSSLHKPIVEKVGIPLALSPDILSKLPLQS